MDSSSIVLILVVDSSAMNIYSEMEYRYVPIQSEIDRYDVEQHNNENIIHHHNRPIMTPFLTHIKGGSRVTGHNQ